MFTVTYRNVPAFFDVYSSIHDFVNPLRFTVAFSQSLFLGWVRDINDALLVFPVNELVTALLSHFLVRCIIRQFLFTSRLISSIGRLLFFSLILFGHFLFKCESQTVDSVVFYPSSIHSTPTRIASITLRFSFFPYLTLAFIAFVSAS